MSSNLKVNTILPSTGSNIGIGTNGGELNVDGGCKVQVGTALTLGHSIGLQYATQNLHSAGFEVNQINASGIITATSFSGSGANLTGITGTTINNNADNRVITGSGTANTLNGEATLTFTNSGSAGSLNLKRTTSSNQETTFYYGSGGLEIETRESTPIILKTNQQPRLRITSSGKTLIGSDSNNNAPRTKLEVLETHDTTGAGTFTPVLRLSTTYYGVEQGPQLQFGTSNVSYHQWIYGDICGGYEGGSFGGALIFRTNSGSSTTAVSERGRWTRDGHLKIKDGNLIIGTGGHGIDFSSTSDASGMTSELLDDYEEGSFTPTTSGISATHNPNGKYVKIGNHVFLSIQFTRSGSANFTFAGGDSGVTISNLPFTNGGHGAVGSIVFPRLANTGSSDGQGATVFVQPGSTQLFVSNAGFSSPRANISVFYSI